MAELRNDRSSATVPSEAEARLALLQLIGGARVTQAIYVAARLNIADLLIDGPKTVDELAVLSHTHAPSLYRLLRALASLGLFLECTDRHFCLTPLAGLLCTLVPRSLRGMALFHGDPYWWRSLGELLYCVQTGQPAPAHVHGVDEWAYLRDHPETAGVFNEAMSLITLEQIPSILAAYDFSSIQALVDVGGGYGVFLAAILSAYPTMRGILVDQAEVVGHAVPVLEAYGVAQRCETRSGDLFAAVPSGADCYLLKLILHDWNDERAHQILVNIRRAMTSSATLVLVERVILPGNEPQAAKLLDLAMLSFPGGRERTAVEWKALLRAAGFVLTGIVPTEAGVSIIESRPAHARARVPSALASA